MPIPNIAYNQIYKHCENLANEAFGLARAKKDIKSVVIGALWYQYFTDESHLLNDMHYGSEGYNAALSELSNFIKSLIDLKKTVYLVLNIPIGVKLNPKFMVERSLINFPYIFKRRAGGFDRVAFNSQYGLIDADLMRIARESGATIINPVDFLCTPERCEALDREEKPIYENSDHLRPSFVRNHAQFMDQTVRD
jgi:hypothetical protein